MMHHTSFAAPEYYSITEAKIQPDALDETLKSGGVVIELKENETFSHNGLDIKAIKDSFVYISGNGNIISAAILDGIVQNPQDNKISSGQIFVHSINNEETDILEFDTKHFLKQSGFTFPEKTTKRLQKISQSQETKKFIGLLESGENNLFNANEVVENIVTALQDQDISEIRINNETMDLSQFQAFAIEENLPLHILISWGASVSDLDIHLTGPQADERFHVFYLNKGSLENDPKAAIIDDCISTNCSEVIRINELKKGGNYRASVYNFGDSASTSNSLANSNVEIEVIRGGTLVEIEGDTDLGSQISGGQSLFKGKPTIGEIGNTWQAIEINPKNSTINFINNITNFDNSRDVE